MPAAASELIQAVGTTSGYDVDKYKCFNIGYTPGQKTGVPILNQSYFAYEVKVTSQTPLEDHVWIAGEIFQAYQDQELFLENGLVNLDRLAIPLYIGRSEYRVLDNHAILQNHSQYFKDD